MKRLFFAFFVATIVCLFGSSRAFAQNPVSWTASAEMLTDTEGIIVLNGVIEPGWHIYGLTMPADGPNPTQIFFSKSGIDFVGSCKVSPAPKKEYDSMYEADLTFWDKKVTFKRAFKLNNPAAAEATITVKYMGCNDSNCIPPRTETFRVKIK